MSRLSIALCTYNGVSFLEEQLRSIADQSRPPDELVVRDDKSTDATVEILRSFESKAPFPVRVVVGESNLGYAKNFEATVRLCTGDIIALSDQDDVWLPTKLERLEVALLADEGHVLAFSDAWLVDEELRPLGTTLWESLRFERELQLRVESGGANTPLFSNTFVTGAACAFRSDLLTTALPFPLTFWHDAWLATLASAAGRIVPVSEPLLLYRQHSRNAIGAPASESRTVRQRIEALKRGSDSANLIEEITGHSLALYSAVHARLAESGQLDAGVGDVLRRRIEHARFRAELPPMPKRIPRAIRELAGGRYHEYSNGARGFVRDLLR